MGNFIILTVGGKIWSGDLSFQDIKGFDPGKINLFQEAVLGCGKKGGLLSIYGSSDQDNPYVQRFKKIMDRLSNGGNPPALRGLSGVVGLGIGLTPSGDDFIAGVLLGERIMSLLFAAGERAEGNISPWIVERKEIGNVLDRTSYWGRTLIWQALQNQFPHYLIKAVRGLARAQSSEEMVKTVKKAVSHGETSGTDALTGLLWYLNKILFDSFPGGI